MIFLDETDSLNLMEFTDLLRTVSKFVVNSICSSSFLSNLIFSLKTDTKWLSWLAYQFHTAVSKRFHSSSSNCTSKDEYMDLETFQNSFYFKVVCILFDKEFVSKEIISILA